MFLYNRDVLFVSLQFRCGVLELLASLTRGVRNVLLLSRSSYELWLLFDLPPSVVSIVHFLTQRSNTMLEFVSSLRTVPIGISCLLLKVYKSTRIILSPLKTLIKVCVKKKFFLHNTSNWQSTKIVPAKVKFKRLNIKGNID